MSLISIPTSIAASPGASQPLLDAVHKQLGTVPNLFRLIGVSPAGLEGFLGLHGALGKGSLDLKTRNRIALAVAEANGCNYCLAAHTYLGKKLAKLSDEEILTNRDGGSTDARADAAVRFAVLVTQKRGHVGADAIRDVQQAGYTDAQIVEIIAHVALNTFTNYLNEAIQTDIDFPAVAPPRAAA